MRKPPLKTFEPADDAGQQANTGDTLDETLRRLGDDFLEEDVPEALLAVLRLGLNSRPDDDPDRTDIDDHAGGAQPGASEG